MSIQHGIRFLLALALAAFLASPVLADNKAVLGTWIITIEDEDFEEADLDITLEIEEDDGELTGTWSTDRGDDDIEDVEWDGKELTFVRIIEVLGRDVEIEHTATVKGDTLEGEFELRSRDIEFSGEREEEGEDEDD